MNDSKLNLAIFGCDTSHSLVFSRLLHDEADPEHVPGVRIVAAVVNGHSFIPATRKSADKFSSAMHETHGVPLYTSVEDLPEDIDGIILGTADGSAHLEEVRLLLKFGVPIFVNKPLAQSGTDAERIFELADEHDVPLMSSSSLRHDDAVVHAIEQSQGSITGADIYGTMELIDGFGGYLWYGIHMAEMLFAAMGTGVEQVSVVHNDFYDLLTGVWADGRLGTIRGTRNPHWKFGGTLHSTTAPISFEVPELTMPYYAKQLQRIVQFMRTGVSPIAKKESIEIIRFLETADKLRVEGRPGPTAILQQKTELVTA